MLSSLYCEMVGVYDNYVLSLPKIFYAARNDSDLCVSGYPFGLAQLRPSYCVIRRILHNSVLLNGAGQGLPNVTVDVYCFSCRT